MATDIKASKSAGTMATSGATDVLDAAPATAAITALPPENDKPCRCMTMVDFMSTFEKHHYRHEDIGRMFVTYMKLWKQQSDAERKAFVQNVAYVNTARDVIHLETCRLRGLVLYYKTSDDVQSRFYADKLATLEAVSLLDM